MRLKGSMASMFLSNEELGKKDDDRKPTKIPPIRAPWGPPQRKTLKRVAVALALGMFVYFFVVNLPGDVPIRDRRHPIYRPEHAGGKLAPPGPMPKLEPDRTSQKPVPPRPPSRPAEEPAAPATSSYDGPLVFPKLRATLQAIGDTMGTYPSNKNVLFAAATLKSAAALLPVACRMGAERRSYVHFALMGGSDIDLAELRAVNGLDDSCLVIFHDARPDFAAISTPLRLRSSVDRALYHIHNFMHPQATLVDASGLEEDYFIPGIRKQAQVSGIPVIELPEDAHSRLGWITKLDSSSLAAWDKISIDILIHALPGASGGLMQLLKALSAADFSAGSVPHLTIELPHNVDRATAEFLKTFQWPPRRYHNPSNSRHLTLRHRISRGRATEDESSVRFLESFWPTNPSYSHVLVLSPQAQLSHLFFHYLKYAALEYLYSSSARLQEWDSRLLGISLDLPSTLLDAATPFKAPSSEELAESSAANTDAATPFLWQAPNSNAALFTGQKWVELHALVSRLLEFEHRTKPLSTFFTEKLVSKRYPSWLEHALKLCRARGYWTLYPSEAIARNLATVHNELFRPPEEYEGELELDAPEGRREPALSPGAFLDSLPGGGTLPPFNRMPLLLWDGRSSDLHDLDNVAAGYASAFRSAVGGCEALRPEDLVPKTTMADLFCLKDEL